MNIVKDVNKLIAIAKMRHREYYVGTVEFDRLLISLGLTVDHLRQLLEEMHSKGITSKLSTIPGSKPFIILKEKAFEEYISGKLKMIEARIVKI